MHLTSKQATEQYKVSIRTLRTLIAGLTAEQKQMHLLIKGKQHLISTELLNQHYQARTGEQVQSEAAKVQKELIAHLTNEVAQLHSRLQESSYIIANLTKQLPAAAAAPPTDTPRPKPNNTTGEPFIWFVVGLVFGLVVIGLVVFFSGF